MMTVIRESERETESKRVTIESDSRQVEKLVEKLKVMLSRLERGHNHVRGFAVDHRDSNSLVACLRTILARLKSVHRTTVEEVLSIATRLPSLYTQNRSTGVTDGALITFHCKKLQ